MRCALALIWDNLEAPRAEVITEQSEQDFIDCLVKEYSSAIDHPSVWLRIKNVFRPISHEPLLRACLTKVIQSFKSRSALAHVEHPIKRKKPTVKVVNNADDFFTPTV